MFSSKDKGANTHYDTLISSKTEITGDVTFTGGLHIDGVIKGNLLAENGSGAVVRVSDKGRVEGQISAPNIIINGNVVGDVYAGEYIELAKKAQVSGDVYYQAMEMVMGAQVNGKLHHQPKVEGRKKTGKTAPEAPAEPAPEVKVD
ncbi:MAG: cell shape determination protein CcmA [Oceanospirillaceae bacterium]|nr:cell shape determination protein CcmA [Oceanospirillum sp.]MBT13768.1 cell shape determination protein CcmA [Oceanospirillaceae bacterium]|tara:strand:+ start:11776 stop:12213 length:438 start_codon:yes stop_codon:yes gene_type:complete